jgi:hypothetical protein
VILSRTLGRCNDISVRSRDGRTILNAGNDETNDKANDIETDDETSGQNGGLSRKTFGIIVIYYAAAIIALIINHWFPFKATTSSILIIILVLAPFIASRVSQFSVGSITLQFRDEIRRSRKILQQDIAKASKNVDNRLAELMNRSKEYLTPQSLDISDQKAAEIRSTINLSAEEVETGLSSFDPNLRVPAYIQLQTRPDPKYVAQLSNCFWLESYLTSTQKETRPLWQLLVAVERCYQKLSDDSLKKHLILSMRHCLEYLDSNATVDRGGQCKERLRLLLADLDKQS